MTIHVDVPSAGTGGAGTGDRSICAWADAQSVGSVTFYPKKRDEAQREFVAIRSLIERRR